MKQCSAQRSIDFLLRENKFLCITLYVVAVLSVLCGIVMFGFGVWRNQPILALAGAVETCLLIPAWRFIQALRRENRLVEVSTNQLRVRAQDAAIGESEEALEALYAGEAMRIGFNAAYLADFLSRAEHQNVRFLFNNADTATEWQPASDAATPDFRYVVMPM